MLLFVGQKPSIQLNYLTVKSTNCQFVVKIKNKTYNAHVYILSHAASSLIRIATLNRRETIVECSYFGTSASGDSSLIMLNAKNKQTMSICGAEYVITHMRQETGCKTTLHAYEC